MDKKEFERVYKKLFKFHIKMVSRLLKSRKDLAEDIVQEAYTNAYSNLDQYDRSKSRPETWLTSKVFWTYRNIKKRENLTYNEEYEEVTISDKELSLVQNYLKELRNEKHRKVIELFYIFGYPSKEIAHLMGMTQTNITTICNRFKQSIKNNERPT